MISKIFGNKPNIAEIDYLSPRDDFEMPIIGSLSRLLTCSYLIITFQRMQIMPPNNCMKTYMTYESLPSLLELSGNIDPNVYFTVSTNVEKDHRI